MAAKLLDVYIKLRELGHPEYCLQQTIGQVLPCGVSRAKADQRVCSVMGCIRTLTRVACVCQVLEANKTLSQWEKEVAQLRTDYEQLLYFSIPKLLHLYHLITVQNPSATAVMQEVSFMFQNEASTRQKLKDVVKVTQ